MSGFKMDCPSCGLILTTPNPVPAGTLLNCPKCGTCFGVPALQTQSAAPAVPVAKAVAVPTPPPVVVPAATPATPAITRARAAAPRPTANEDSWFPELDTASPRVRPGKPSRKEKEAESKGSERPAKRGKKRRDNAPLIWSLVAVGAVIVIGGAVGLMKFAGGPPAKENHHHAGTPEKAVADSPPEKKAAAAAPAPTVKKEKAAPDRKKAAKKDKTTGATTAKKKDAMADDNPNEPIPIPGVQIPEKGKQR